MNPHDPTLISLPLTLCARRSPVPARLSARKHNSCLGPGPLRDFGAALLLDHGLLLHLNPIPALLQGLGATLLLDHGPTLLWGPALLQDLGVALLLDYGPALLLHLNRIPALLLDFRSGHALGVAIRGESRTRHCTWGCQDPPSPLLKGPHF